MANLKLIVSKGGGMCQNRYPRSCGFKREKSQKEKVRILLLFLKYSFPNQEAVCLRYSNILGS